MLSSFLPTEESPGKMYALAVVLTLLAIVAVGLRFWARRLTKSGFAWDDFFIVLALMFTIGTGVCMFIATAKGSLGQHTKFDPETGYPIVDDPLVVTMHTGFASQLTQTFAFGFTKLAVLFFYKRFLIGRSLEICLWTMITVTVAWTVAFFFANLLQCLPLSVNWNALGYSPGACIHTDRMYLAQAHSDIWTDVLILSLPIRPIWTLQMPRSSKIAVSSLLLLGTLVVVAGIGKLVILYRVVQAIASGESDVAYILTPTFYWPMIEASLGVVGASLPTMRPIAKRYIPEGSFQRLKSRTSSTWSFFGRRHSSSEKSALSRPSTEAGKPKLRVDQTMPVSAMDEGCCDSRW